MKKRSASHRPVRWFDGIALSGRSVVGFAAGLAILLGLSFLSYWSTREFLETTQWVHRIREVRAAIREVYSDIRDLQTRVRGFIITGREAWLSAYSQEIRKLTQDQQTLRELVSDNPRQQERLAKLQALVAERLAYAERTIATRRTGGFEPAAQLVTQGHGEELMAAIRTLLAEMERDAEQLLQQRQAACDRAIARTFVILPVGTALGLGLLLAVLFYLNAEIAERRRAEVSLRENEQRLSGLIASAMDPIISADSSQRIVLFNAAAEKVFRCAAADALGQSIGRFIPARFREAHRQHVERFGRTGVTNRAMNALGTVSGLRADGGEFPIEASISQIEIGGEKLYTVILRDVTERKRAEEALRKSEEGAHVLNRRLETLQQALAQLAAVRTLDEVVTVARTAARQLTGADGATFVLRDGDQCFYVDEDAVAPLWKGRRFPMTDCISGWVILNHRSVTIEDIYADPRIPTDAYRPTFVKSLAMVPIRTAEPLGAIGNYWATRHQPTREELDLLRSLADGVAVAMENVESYRLLERRVSERTAQLEAANKELEAFSYSVSHDLRAPLRAIVGYGRILLEDHGARLEAEGHRVVDVIQSEAERMGRLIDDLLDFSRLGRKRLEPTPVDMTELSRGVFQSLTSNAGTRVPRLILGALPSVPGDPAMLRQVWVNLFANALKFTRHAESPVIEVDGSIADSVATYFVRDNGVGFDERYAHKLFGVFQRLHKEEEFEGTGVGLALVQRVVHRHGGRVWAQGKLNVGATFFFTLPTAEVRPPEDP